MFTQPIMYSIIKKHPNVMDIYSKKLISEGVVTKEEFGATVDKYERICEDAYKKAGEETQVGQKNDSFKSKFLNVCSPSDIPQALAGLTLVRLLRG